MVFSSSIRKSITSSIPIILSFPRARKPRIPIPLLKHELRAIPPTFPECDAIVVQPGTRSIFITEIFNLFKGLITPITFGPKKLIPFSFAKTISSSSRTCPSSPVSLKPLVTTIAFSRPQTFISLTISITAGAGTTMTTSSTFSGSSERFLKHLTPAIFSLSGFT